MTGHAFGATGAHSKAYFFGHAQSMEYQDCIPMHYKLFKSLNLGTCGFTEDIPIVYETRDQEVDSVCITTHGYSGELICLSCIST